MNQFSSFPIITANITISPLVPFSEEYWMSTIVLFWNEWLHACHQRTANDHLVLDECGCSESMRVLECMDCSGRSVWELRMLNSLLCRELWLWCLLLLQLPALAILQQPPLRCAHPLLYHHPPVCLEGHWRWTRRDQPQISCTDILSDCSNWLPRLSIPRIMWSGHSHKFNQFSLVCQLNQQLSDHSHSVYCWYSPYRSAAWCHSWQLFWSRMVLVSQGWMPTECPQML